MKNTGKRRTRLQKHIYIIDARSTDTRRTECRPPPLQVVKGFVTTDEYGNLVVDRATKPPQIEVEGLPPGKQHKREGHVDMLSPPASSAVV